jgi:serine/threonine protein kinase
LSNLIGHSLGAYHILEQLGEGGMATVFRAYDTRLDRDVAVKVIRVDQFAPAILGRMLKRFDREAKVLANMTHPNIVHVNDYGQQDGIPYLVMDYLTGGTLKQRLDQPMSWTEAASLLLPIAHALQYAHNLGIIHRDIKPANILISNSGQSMLSDFGIAKLLDIEESMTMTGTGIGVGTPGYMAPEQWVGNTTSQSDIYSLGVVFFELITGRKPYIADTPAAVLLKQANDPLPRPKSFLPELPEGVERVILKALAKNCEHRYKSMEDFAKALEECESGQIITKKIKAVSIIRWMLPVIACLAIILFFGNRLLQNENKNQKVAPQIFQATTVSHIQTTLEKPTIIATKIVTPTATLSPQDQEVVDHPENYSSVVTSGTGIQVEVLSFVNAGQLISDGTVIIDPYARIHSYTFALNLYGRQADQPVVISAPPGYGITTIAIDSRYSDLFTVGLPIPAMLGTYTLKNGDLTSSFDLINVPEKLLVANPSFEVENGIIKAVRIQWVIGDSGNVISNDVVSKVIRSFEVQISGTGEQCTVYPQESDRLYNSGTQYADTLIVPIDCPNLNFSQVTNLGIAYRDRYNGNVILHYWK